VELTEIHLDLESNTSYPFSILSKLSSAIFLPDITQQFVGCKPPVDTECYGLRVTSESLMG